MGRIRKFIALSAADKRLLLGCVPIVATMRLGLTFLSYRRISRLMPAALAAETTEAVSREELRRIAWGVRTAARLVPRATCLTQALAAQFLLARHGQLSRIRVGVARDVEGRFLAHAWLVSNGYIIIGGSPAELGRFTPIADLDLKPS